MARCRTRCRTTYPCRRPSAAIGSASDRPALRCRGYGSVGGLSGVVPLMHTLYGAKPAEVMADVYFRPDFMALHALRDGVETLEFPGFRHAAAVRQIPGTDFEDLETPWGYGGPVALDESAFWQGLGL